MKNEKKPEEEKNDATPTEERVSKIKEFTSKYKDKG